MAAAKEVLYKLMSLEELEPKIRGLLVELAQNQSFVSKRHQPLGDDFTPGACPQVRELVDIVKKDRKPNTYSGPDHVGQSHIVISEGSSRSKKIILPELTRALKQYLCLTELAIFSSDHDVELRPNRDTKQIEINVTDANGNGVATFSVYPLAGLKTIHSGLQKDFKEKQDKLLHQLKANASFFGLIQRYTKLVNPGQTDEIKLEWDGPSKGQLLNINNSQGKTLVQVDVSKLRHLHGDNPTSDKAIRHLSESSEEFLVFGQEVRALQETIDVCIQSLEKNKLGANVRFFVIPNSNSESEFRLCVTDGSLLGTTRQIYNAAVTKDRFNDLVKASENIAQVNDVKKFKLCLYLACNPEDPDFIEHSLYQATNAALNMAKVKDTKGSVAARTTLSKQTKSLLGSLANSVKASTRTDSGRADVRDIFSQSKAAEPPQVAAAAEPPQAAAAAEPPQAANRPSPLPSPRTRQKLEAQQNSNGGDGSNRSPLLTLKFPPSPDSTTQQVSGVQAGSNDNQLSPDAPGASVLAAMGSNESPRLLLKSKAAAEEALKPRVPRPASCGSLTQALAASSAPSPLSRPVSSFNVGELSQAAQAAAASNGNPPQKPPRGQAKSTENLNQDAPKGSLEIITVVARPVTPNKGLDSPGS